MRMNSSSSKSNDVKNAESMLNSIRYVNVTIRYVYPEGSFVTSTDTTNIKARSRVSNVNDVRLLYNFCEAVKKAHIVASDGYYQIDTMVTFHSLFSESTIYFNRKMNVIQIKKGFYRLKDNDPSVKLLKSIIDLDIKSKRRD